MSPVDLLSASSLPLPRITIPSRGDAAESPTAEDVIAAAARAAGEPSVAELVVEHRDRIRRWARHMSTGEAEADDLAQEAMLRALRSAHTYRPGTHFRAWMKTIVRNLAINGGRRREKAPRTASTEAMERAIEEAPARAETVTLMHGADLLRRRDLLSGPVARALEGLSDAYRRVLLLWAVEGLAYREIADALGIPVGTVMSRLHRARRAMKESLDGHLDGNLVPTS